MNDVTPEERAAYDAGFERALDQYAIWKDGVQRIGCMETDIRTITVPEDYRALDIGRLHD